MPNEQGKKNQFLLHGGLLAVASLLVRLIGLLYRVPMAAIIGSEGSGYYSNAFQVYNILLLLSSYSLPLAVSKMVSARVEFGKWKETRKILHVSLGFAAVIGLAFGLVTFFGADFFCSKIINSPNSALALKCLAPTVTIVAFLGVLRGFYQGLQTMIPTSVSQVIEQIINAAVSIGAAAILVGIATSSILYASNPSLPAIYGAAGGTIGTGAGALAALIFTVILMVKYRPVLLKNVSKDARKSTNSYANLLKVLVLTAVPVIFSTAAYNSVDIIDSALFNNAMNARGIEESVYAATWGDYNNAFLTLVHLPVAISSALAAALVPSLSAAHARHDIREELSKITLTLRVTILFAVPVSLGMTAIGGNLAKLLFRSISAEAERYLVVGGISVLIFSLSTVTNAILQGLNHMERPALHALIALAGQSLLLVFLLFVCKANVFAVIICYMIFGLIMLVLNLLSIRKLTGFKLNPVKTILLPFAIGGAMVLVLFLLSFLITRFVSGTAANLLIVLFGLLIGASFYLAGILLAGCITKAQLLELPYGAKLVRLFEKLHLLKGEKK